MQRSQAAEHHRHCQQRHTDKHTLSQQPNVLYWLHLTSTLSKEVSSLWLTVLHMHAGSNTTAFFIWKTHQVLIPSEREGHCNRENSHLFFSNNVFTNAKKKGKTPLDLNWIEMKWNQDGAAATRFSINVSLTAENEDFCAFHVKTVVSPDSVSSLRFNLLILNWFCWKEWKCTALFLLFPTVQLGRYFNATSGHKTEVVVGKEHNSSQHTGAQGSYSFKCKDLPFYHSSHSNWSCSQCQQYTLFLKHKPCGL